MSVAKRGQGSRSPPEPPEAEQRLALARARPAQLLFPEGAPVRGRVGQHERGRLVDGPPAAAQQLVREHPVVADVQRHAEDVLAHEALDSRLEGLATVCDRPSGEASHLAEDRLCGNRQVVPQVLDPVGEPAHRAGAHVKDRLARRDTPDARILERAQHLGQVPACQTVSESTTTTTSVAGSLAARPAAIAARLPDFGISMTRSQ